MNNELKTSLWFYTGADYLIINSFLWKDKGALEECMEIVWNNNRGMIREAEEQTAQRRFSSSGIDEAELLESYRRRTPESLTNAAKDSMIEQAIADIDCICRAMEPAPCDMELVRNLDSHTALGNVRIGDTADLLGLTSTSTTGQLIDYGKENYRKPDQILKIHIAAGLPLLRMENDRENEVILPPMTYRVVDRAHENGVDVITMEAISPLDLDHVIREAKAAWTKSASH